MAVISIRLSSIITGTTYIRALLYFVTWTRLPVVASDATDD
jgi:hypothetical protein